MRLPWPARYFRVYGAFGSALLLGATSPSTAIAISAITLFYLFPLHRLWRTVAHRADSSNLKRIMLPLGVGGLVVFLILFKVYRHFTVPWLEGPWLQSQVLSIIGFSYFLFRAISFMHIQKILDIDERTPWGLLFYTLFPPTITSGPIQTFQDFRHQLDNPIPLSVSSLGTATYRITRGYFRKVIVAYALNEAVEYLLGLPELTFSISVITVTLLYLYFYFDFAGYSDIAIGFGLLMGIKVPENFRKPFLATSVTEFWRNWHITLVEWFRNNVFIPLGGMRSSRIHSAFLAFLIMLLCGLWHGLTLSFLMWGFWHGFILFLEAVTGSKPMQPSLRRGPKYWLRLLWTNARVAAGCILFLPDSNTIFRVLNGFTRF